MTTLAKVSILSIPAKLQNGDDIMHPVVIWDDMQAILVDTGLPGAAEQIAGAMYAAGVSLSLLTHIVLTHADTDHIGSLGRLLSMAPQSVSILCHAQEKPYIQCDVPPLRLAKMEERVDKLSGEQHAQLLALVQSLRANYKSLGVPVTGTVEDGQLLPCGIQVVYTPGHTPGHISLYLKSSRMLIAGDALNVTGGELLSAPDWFLYDRTAMQASLRKLASYDIETVVCYHGGVYRGDVHFRLQELATRYFNR